MAKNLSKVSLALGTAILNLRLYKKMFDFATLSNSPNIFSKSWIIMEEIRYALAEIRFALALITSKAVFLQWFLIESILFYL